MTASTIAGFGLRAGATLASLRSANQLRNDTIKVGQTLNIPATALAAQP